MTPHTPLIEALKDALFALDGVLDGDFSPRGSTVKGAIKTVREALRIATETTEPDADKDGATKDDWSVEQLFEQIEMRLSCRHESELDGGDFRFIEDRLARIKGAQFAAQSSPSVQSIRAEALEVLEWIKRHYGNGDMNHEDFRVEVYCMALKVLENTHDS